MTRRQLIKTIIAFSITPKLISDIAVFKDVKPKINQKFKIGAYFKVAKEMIDDTKMMEHFIEYQAKKAGIDIDKEFNTTISWSNDDFIHRPNLLTCVISQYVEKNPNND